MVSSDAVRCTCIDRSKLLCLFGHNETERRVHDNEEICVLSCQG